MMKGRKMKMARWNGERGRANGMGERLKEEDQRTLGKFQRETRKTE